MQPNNVDTIANAIGNAIALRGWSYTSYPTFDRAQTLIAFCDKRDLTLHSVYVGNAGSGFTRAVVIRSDGMARRVYYYGGWTYANTRIAPIAQLRINRFHVTV